MCKKWDQKGGKKILWTGLKNVLMLIASRNNYSSMDTDWRRNLEVETIPQDFRIVPFNVRADRGFARRDGAVFGLSQFCGLCSRHGTREFR